MIFFSYLTDFSYFPMNFFFCKLQDKVWTVQKWTCSKAGAIQKKYLNDQDYSYLSVLQDLCVSLELVVLNIYKLWENCTKICSHFHSSCQARYHFASQFKNVDIYIYNFIIKLGIFKRILEEIFLFFAFSN
jgi:hypothetical protein